LKDDSKIYKLIGPVLVPQDRPEANSNVEKRLEFIQGEVKRVDDLINTSQKKLEEKRNEVSIQSSSSSSINYTC
jgi:prefoldin beta subunit